MTTADIRTVYPQITLTAIAETGEKVITFSITYKQTIAGTNCHIERSTWAWSKNATQAERDSLMPRLLEAIREQALAILPLLGACDAVEVATATTNYRYSECYTDC